MIERMGGKNIKGKIKGGPSSKEGEK